MARYLLCLQANNTPWKSVIRKLLVKRPLFSLLWTCSVSEIYPLIESKLSLRYASVNQSFVS